MKTEKQSHTPGPWEVSNDSRNIVSSGHKKVFICEVLDHVRVTSESETCNASEATANAYLIASAPDLLAAAKDLIAYFDEFGHADANQELGANGLRAAIAKAEGREVA